MSNQKKLKYPEPGTGVAVVTTTDEDKRFQVAFELFKMLVADVKKSEDRPQAIRQAVFLADQFLAELAKK